MIWACQVGPISIQITITCRCTRYVSDKQVMSNLWVAAYALKRNILAKLCAKMLRFQGQTDTPCWDIVFGPWLVLRSLHNILGIDKNGNFRMLKRGIPTLINFEVLRLLYNATQRVIFSKSNTLPEFVGIQYLWVKTLFLAFVIKKLSNIQIFYRSSILHKVNQHH